MAEIALPLDKIAEPPMTAFCRERGVASEAEYKRRCRDEGRIGYHMHLGLDDWPATARALTEVDAAMRASGHIMDRYGLCLSRSMGVVEDERAAAAKETGPRLAPGDWTAIAETVPIQP